MAHWTAGKTLNPAFQAMVDEHHSWEREIRQSCPITSPTYTSLRAHNAWRKGFERHSGQKLPPTFLTPPKAPKKRANRNVSQVQGNWVLDLQNKATEQD